MENQKYPFHVNWCVLSGNLISQCDSKQKNSSVLFNFQEKHFSLSPKKWQKIHLKSTNIMLLLFIEHTSNKKL